MCRHPCQHHLPLFMIQVKEEDEETDEKAERAMVHIEISYQC